MRLIIIFVVLSLSCTLNARKKRIPLSGKLAPYLNSLLDQSLSLHKAMVNEKETEAQKHVKVLKSSIEDILLLIKGNRSSDQGVLLRKILTRTQQNMEAYLNIPDEKQRELKMKQAYSQLAQLVRVYEVDKKFRIFNCTKDRSEWIQTGWRAQYPFDPQKYQRCGIRVR